MTQATQPSAVVGILLAAGFSRRFGEQDKLMHLLTSQENHSGSINSRLTVAETSALALIEALPYSVAVVREENQALQTLLAARGLHVALSTSRDAVMADSLKQGIRAAKAAFPRAAGFIIALADMPFIRPQTITQIAEHLAAAAIVQPMFNGQPGNPVGFSQKFADTLLALEGDQGARGVLRAHQDEVLRMPCDDEGILRDIDTMADLPG